MDTNPTPAPDATAAKRSALAAYLLDFKVFLLKTNALAVAIGICLGIAVNDLVKAVVATFISPIFGLIPALGPELTIWIFPIGVFLSAAIYFVMIAFVLYTISKLFIREEKRAA